MKRSDGLWRFACGDVSISALWFLIVAALVVNSYFNCSVCTAFANCPYTSFFTEKWRAPGWGSVTKRKSSSHYERWCTDTSGYDNTAPDWTMGGVWGDQPSWYRSQIMIFTDKRYLILVLEAQKWTVNEVLWSWITFNRCWEMYHCNDAVYHISSDFHWLTRYWKCQGSSTCWQQATHRTSRGEEVCRFRIFWPNTRKNKILIKHQKKTDSDQTQVKSDPTNKTFWRTTRRIELTTTHKSTWKPDLTI